MCSIRNALENYNLQGPGKNNVKNLLLIDQADVEIIKLNFQGLFVDISIRQLGGLCTLDFMTFLDSLVAKDHLLKKTIILIKAWFTYEASFLGSYAACMATYALYVLVIFVFNNYQEELQTPMDVFRRFFQVWGTFDWEAHLVTMYSPIKTVNYYERLRNECNFEMDRLALLERISLTEFNERQLMVTPDRLNSR
jgi:poly(A) polymerase Pap1